jgi:3-deoxy-D-manno-octulosonic-acid transferase
MTDRPASAAWTWRQALPYIVYNVLLTLAFPLVVVYLAVRLTRGKSRSGFMERLGLLPQRVRDFARSGDPVIWIQAASVGEVNAAAPILAQLRLHLPLARLVLSVTTPTGRAVAGRRDLGVDAVIYFPFDIPFIVRHVLQTLRPVALVMVETELWPVLLAQARHRGIATIVVNGRISDRAYPRARTIWSLYRWMTGNLDLVCAQSEVDADRFRGLGTAADRIIISGNSKFDEKFAQVLPEQAARWRQEFGFSEQAEILVAGSTHEGEEDAILTVFDHLRFTHPELQLIVAPRHPERGDRVHSLVREHGYDVYRRSHVLAALEAGEEPPLSPAGPAARVVILDSVGELATVYGCANVVFVGGSLIKGLAGHNILEAIAQGKPTLCGPFMVDFRDITSISLREGCAVQVRAADELEAAVEFALSPEQQTSEEASRRMAMIGKYRGASERYAEAVEGLLAAHGIATDSGRRPASPGGAA